MARVAATTDHSIDVEWDPPIDNGGGEILGYHVDKVRFQSSTPNSGCVFTTVLISVLLPAIP